MASQTNRVLDAVMKAGRVGSWTFVERLGSGGFGLVMKARRNGIDGSRQEAAIKLLAHDGAMSPEAMILFNHEFNVLKRLASPYIASVLDSGMDSVNLGRGATANVQWIATEHIKGDDLRQEIKNHGPLDKAQWLEFAHDLLSAVEVAHAAAVIHRDIKPDNIMRLSRKSVLIDFGGASFEAELDPGDRYVTYTPGFAAPEQLDGSNPENLTAAADIFAVGCLLHFAATASSPWGGDWRRAPEPASAWFKTITREQPDLDALDEEQSELISKMISLHKRERITASHALAEIEELLPDSSARSSIGKGHTASGRQHDASAPEAGQEFDEFELDEQAQEVEEAQATPRAKARAEKQDVKYSTKSFSAALTLATWFGIFGVHRFYLGKTGSALVQLFTGGGYLFWWVSDVKKLLRGEFTDGNGHLLRVSDEELSDARKSLKRNSWFLVALIVFLAFIGQMGGGSESAPNTADSIPSAVAVKNVVGMNLSDAAANLRDFTVDEVDALDSTRTVFVESNWKVCGQSPSTGYLSGSATITLKVVKLEETCP